MKLRLDEAVVLLILLMKSCKVRALELPHLVLVSVMPFVSYSTKEAAL